MSEIKKMYENAEVKKQIPKICSNNELYCKGCKAHIENAMPYCKSAEYPTFTAEKQLSLIIFLSYKYGKGLLINLRTMDKDVDIYDFELFGECLAKLVNELWQDLTEEEKQQVKGILE